MTRRRATGALRGPTVLCVPAIRTRIPTPDPADGQDQGPKQPAHELRGPPSSGNSRGQAFGAGEGRDDQNDLEGACRDLSRAYSGRHGARSDFWRHSTRFDGEDRDGEGSGGSGKGSSEAFGAGDDHDGPEHQEQPSQAPDQGAPHVPEPTDDSGGQGGSDGDQKDETPGGVDPVCGGNPSQRRNQRHSNQGGAPSGRHTESYGSRPLLLIRPTTSLKCFFERFAQRPPLRWPRTAHSCPPNTVNQQLCRTWGLRKELGAMHTGTAQSRLPGILGGSRGYLKRRWRAFRA